MGHIRKLTNIWILVKSLSTYDILNSSIMQFTKNLQDTCVLYVEKCYSQILNSIQSNKHF